MHAPQALVFDAYGTLFDVHSVTRLADSLFPGRGAALSQAWRSKQLEYTWLRSLMGRYDDFGAVTEGALDWALESLGLAARAGDRTALLLAYRTLGTFPEVRGALERLGERRPLAILSNGHPDMLDAVVDHNELRIFFGERVFSVHEAGVYKPDPRVYAIATAGLELPADAIGFVSSNGWDAAGARSFGFTAFWVNRGKAPVDRLGSPPDAVVEDLAGLARLLAA
ncbi:MAG TPA: haloacid dehalogenase type II [Usitatibacteraceae bacterium]|nr:haloacid dehalogenase type II [Usitatibacteraceae bacterium]